MQQSSTPPSNYQMMSAAAEKKTIDQRSQVGKSYSTATHKQNNNSTRDGKHVKFKIKPYIATYQQHDNKPMVTYNLGPDGHYISEQDRSK